MINLSGQQAQAPASRWTGRTCLAAAIGSSDLLSGAVFVRDGGELAGPGLFVDLEPWQYHVLSPR